MDLKQTLKKHLDKIDKVIENGKHKDNWQSLANHKVPDWYKNAKFGIFIHWGVYTVPVFGNEWYPRHMYRIGKFRRQQEDYYTFHRENFGAQTEFGYKDFIPMFKAEKFDAGQWADIFAKSGAKFVMPVAEHHDGFQMYDSELSQWCASKMGPNKDIVAELKTEVESKGMVFTTSSHRAEHYWFMSGARTYDSDLPKDLEYGHIYWPAVEGDNPKENKTIFEPGIKNMDPLFLEDFLARTCEIVDKYQPKILYFDGGINHVDMKPYLKKLAAYYYNRADEWGEEVTINYKRNAFMHGVGVRDIERGQLSGLSADFWQNDTSVANASWSYVPWLDYKETPDIIRDMVDVVSKNGSYLLNIGPKADGSIPEKDKEILLEIGEWLKINGEGIYDTSHWRIFGEGPTLVPEGHMTDLERKNFTSMDIRFTYKAGELYAFFMQWPKDSVAKIPSLAQKNEDDKSFLVTDVSILGYENIKTTFKHTVEGLTVIAEDCIDTDNPVCIKISFE